MVTDLVGKLVEVEVLRMNGWQKFDEGRVRAVWCTEDFFLLLEDQSGVLQQYHFIEGYRFSIIRENHDDRA